MKKEFLKFPSRHINYAPKIQSRRMGFKPFISAAYKSDGGGDDSEKAKLLKDIQDKVKAELETRGYLSKTDVDSLIAKQFEGMDLDALRKYKASSEELNTTVQSLAAKLEKLEKRAGGNSDRPQTIAQQIRSHIEKNKEKWAQFKRHEIHSFEMEVRAPAAMTIAASGSSGLPVTEVEVIPGLIDLPRNRPFMLAISNVGNTDKPSVEWVEKFNPEGQAEFLGEGEVKPLIDFNYRGVRSSAKKAAAKIKSSTEQLDDIDWMAAEIEKELRYQVELAVSIGLLSGDGTGDNLVGLDSYAGGYVLTSIEVDNAKRPDAIRAAIAQIRSLNFNANVVVLNPIDTANMEMEKGVDNHYIIPPFRAADGTMISGVRVIEENGIPVGSLLVGDMTRFRVRIYKPFAVSYGWVNDDFEKNMVTIIGEMRLHSFVSANDTGAFVYDTFANILSAIETL